MASRSGPHRRNGWVFLLLLTLNLSACGNLATVKEAWRAATGRTPEPDGSRLNPAYQYVRFTSGTHATILFLGDRDVSAAGPLDVYYSVDGVVLKLHNGRLAGVHGFPTEWRNVVLKDAPVWRDVMQHRERQWLRVRDVMPLYQLGLQERIHTRQIAPPNIPLIKSPVTGDVIWFEDTVIESTSTTVSRHMPPARYGVVFDKGEETAVYGEQCVRVDLCFTWQLDRKSTRLNSSHVSESRMPSSA